MSTCPATRVLLNGIFNCPVYVSADGHPLTVIASDGQVGAHRDYLLFIFFVCLLCEFVYF